MKLGTNDRYDKLYCVIKNHTHITYQSHYVPISFSLSNKNCCHRFLSFNLFSISQFTMTWVNRINWGESVSFCLITLVTVCCICKLISITIQYFILFNASNNFFCRGVNAARRTLSRVGKCSLFPLTTKM